MLERIPKLEISQVESESLERRRGSPEDALLSDAVYNLVGNAHHLSPEDLKGRLIVIADRVADLEKKSRTDELTGLLNLRGFREEVSRFESIFARERRDNDAETPVVLLMIDIDGFKEVNDTCGHEGGNRGLRLIAEQVQGVLRESDIFARVGGDEFSIFLPREDKEGAMKVAQKVRVAIEDSVTQTIHRDFPKYEGKLSASIGVAAVDGKGTIDGKVDATIEQIMTYADYASYVVKAAGKRGELSLEEAREVDADGKFEEDFLKGKVLPR
jgi:diguanylate cyclase (GGDEF)-like protein